MTVGINWLHLGTTALPNALVGLVIGALVSAPRRTHEGRRKFDTDLFIRMAVFWTLGKTLQQLFERSGFSQVSLLGQILPILPLAILCFASPREFIAGLVPALVAISDAFRVQLGEMNGDSRPLQHWLDFVQIWPVRIATSAILLTLLVSQYRRRKPRGNLAPERPVPDRRREPMSILNPP